MSDADVGPTPADELELLALLRRALGPDPVPDGLHHRAESLITFMDIDRELLELVADQPAELAGARGEATRRAGLVFASRAGSVSVEVGVRGDRLEGQVLGAAPSEVVLEHLDGQTTRGEVGELGRFSVDRLGGGPVRLRLQGGGLDPVLTDWFPL